MKTKTIVISYLAFAFFVALAMLFLFYLPFLVGFQGYTGYFFSILGPLAIFFAYLRGGAKVSRLIKKRRKVKKIIEKWYENHPEKYKKSFIVGGGILKKGPVFKSDAVQEKISPRDVFLETQAETELGLRWIKDYISFVDKKDVEKNLY